MRLDLEILDDFKYWLRIKRDQISWIYSAVLYYSKGVILAGEDIVT